MTGNLALLALLWGLWCTLHSWLVLPRVTAWIRRHLGTGFGYFRLGYNLFALATVLPIAVWAHHLPGPELVSWKGLWRLPQGLLWLAAAGIFWQGLRHYPMAEFVGIRQIGRARKGQGPPEKEPLATDGILRMVRHPWYAAALIVLWCRDLNAAGLVTSVVLTLYLFIGARLEEAKLVAEYGETYRRYRRQVSMFFPWKWLRGKLC